MSVNRKYTHGEQTNLIVAELNRFRRTMSEIARRSERGTANTELCHTMYKMTDSILEWAGLPGHVKIIVAFQPMMDFAEEDDAIYGDVD